MTKYCSIVRKILSLVLSDYAGQKAAPYRWNFLHGTMVWSTTTFGGERVPVHRFDTSSVAVATSSTDRGESHGLVYRYCIGVRAQYANEAHWSRTVYIRLFSDLLSTRLTGLDKP